jgi:hypothetical protein
VPRVNFSNAVYVKPPEMALTWGWPAGCILPGPARVIVEGTHVKGEIPCFGCPYLAACEDRQDTNLEATAALLDVPLNELVLNGGRYRECPGCGGQMTRWETFPRAGIRRWTCRAPIQIRVITEELSSVMRDDYCKRVYDRPVKNPKLGAGDLHSPDSA